jgi:hypothetical protein
MSVFCLPEKLDWARGEHLAQAAYATRWRARRRSPFTRTALQWAMNMGRKQREAWLSVGTNLIEPVLPAIVAMHFEQDGVVLARRPDDGGVS